MKEGLTALAAATVFLGFAWMMFHHDNKAAEENMKLIEMGVYGLPVEEASKIIRERTKLEAMSCRCGQGVSP